jgi:hypothetical protein
MKTARLEDPGLEAAPSKAGDRDWLEFGGPLGCGLLTFGLPGVLYVWYAFLRSGPLDLERFVPGVAEFAVVAGWLVFQAALQHFAPGPTVLGRPLIEDEFARADGLRPGERLAYRCNGWASLAATVVLAAALAVTGTLDPTWVVASMEGLMSAALGVAIAISLGLHASNRHPGRQGFEAFFLGVARNPRGPAGFDLKFFCEGRPSLFAWILLDVILAWEQLRRTGEVSPAMAIVVLSQLVYLLDYLVHERAILSIHDIQTERFGFMMCFGDLVWVPFGFTLQAFYLLESGARPETATLVAAVVLQLLGYAIFRLANLQKHRFLEDPERPIPSLRRLWKRRTTAPGRAPRSIAAASATGDDRLLVDGLWRVVRHPNYLGDFLLGLGWCLTCGFESVLPYFYVFYFGPLLAHRERRDDRNCERRFGVAWERYRALVPNRLVPYLY